MRCDQPVERGYTTASIVCIANVGSFMNYI